MTGRQISGEATGSGLARGWLAVAALFVAIRLAVGAIARDEDAAPDVGQGRALYQAHGCSGCHGQSGHGDGPGGGSLDVKPRDFRDRASFKRGRDPDDIADTIARGLRSDRPSPSGHDQLMPKFAHLSRSERRSLAAYVLSIRAEAATGQSK